MESRMWFPSAEIKERENVSGQGGRVNRKLIDGQ